MHENDAKHEKSVTSEVAKASSAPSAQCVDGEGTSTSGDGNSQVPRQARNLFVLHLAAHVAFVTALRTSRSKWAAAATDFYVASLLTGIRPDEWDDARKLHIGNRPALWVLFLKDIASLCPVGRRTVMLDKYDSELVELIYRHHSRVWDCTESEFRSLHASCRRLMRRVADRAFPAAYPYPSLDGCSTLSKKERIAVARAAVSDLRTHRH